MPRDIREFDRDDLSCWDAQLFEGPLAMTQWTIEERFIAKNERRREPWRWRDAIDHFKPCGVAPDADARFALGLRIPDEILRHLDVESRRAAQSHQQPAISQIPWQEPRLVQH
jgi:hypothetical protein